MNTQQKQANALAIVILHLGGALLFLMLATFVIGGEKLDIEGRLFAATAALMWGFGQAGIVHGLDAYKPVADLLMGEGDDA